MTTPPDVLDAADPLAAFRDRFVIDDDLVAYLDGNSLGRVPKATVERLGTFVREEWGSRLIRGWDDSWVELPVTVGDELGAALLGAAPGQTVIADSTSVNIYKLLHAAAGLRPDRDEIVIDATNFPTDRYLVESVAAARGMTVRWLEPDLIDNVTVDVLARGARRAYGARRPEPGRLPLRHAGRPARRHAARARRGRPRAVGSVPLGRRPADRPRRGAGRLRGRLHLQVPQQRARRSCVHVRRRAPRRERDPADLRVVQRRRPVRDVRHVRGGARRSGGCSAARRRSPGSSRCRRAYA